MADYYAIITQKGYSLEVSDVNLPHQFSSNIPIKIIKDTQTFSNYDLLPFFVHSTRQYIDAVRANEGILMEYDEVSQIAILPYSAFNKKGYLFISLAMKEKNGDKVLYTGSARFDIKESINGEDTIPVESVWIDAITKYVDTYMNEKYKPTYDALLENAEDLQGQAESLHNTVTQQQQNINNTLQTTQGLQENIEEINETTKQLQQTTTQLQNNVNLTVQKATQQQDQIDDAIDVMGDYEIVQDNPTQIRFKKGDGTYGDTVNLGDNLASKSMVNAGYDTYSGNSYSGSASDYGIEIGKASGNYEQVTTKGYQLFDASKLSTKTQGGATVTNNGDGSFTISGSGSLSGGFTHDYTLTHEDTVKLLKSGKLYLGVGKVLMPRLEIGLTNIKTNAWVKTPIVLKDTIQTLDIIASELENEDYALKYKFYGLNTATITGGTIKPMLYQDGDGTWEPFTGGEPAPNPNYPLEPKFFEPTVLESFGKNLFKVEESMGGTKSGITWSIDKDGYITLNGTASGNFYVFQFQYNSEVPIKGEVVPKIEIVSGSGTGMFSIGINSENSKKADIGQYDYSTGTLKNFNKVFDGKMIFSYIYVFNNDVFNNCKFRISVYLKSQEQEEYSQFSQSAIPLNITLRALPNEVCDTYEDGVITRRIGVIEFDGSDDEVWYKNSASNNDNWLYYITYYHIKAVALSNKLEHKNIAGSTNIINGDSSLDRVGFNLNFNEGVIYINIGYYMQQEGLSNNKDDLKAYLQSHPIKVYYELSTPTTEKVTLPVIPSYFHYTNAWHDSEVEASDLTWFINTYARNNEYTDEFLQKFFALQRTGKVYTVKFPLFSKSISPTGEKLDNNAGLTCEPSTDTIIGQDDYQDIPLFKTYDVNAYADDNGRIHVTAFKGDKYFKDMGKVDVFVLGMSYYEKYWEDDNYWYYSRTDMPRDGYTLCAECRNTDGSESSYALYSKYVSGEIDGKPYSSKGLIPKRNMSYNVCESYYHSRGKNYGGSPMYLYKYLMTTFYLKYATLNTQSKIYGCFNYSYQYAASMAENNVKRIVLTTAQAANIVVGSYVSIGDKGSNSSVDRSNSYMHNKAEEVEVISKTTVDDSHVAINVDSPTSFNTTTTTYLSTMHWKSGFSDNVLGRDGSIGDLTSGKYPMILQGIELAVGGYEVAGNAFMDIVNSTGKRDIYVTNDNSKIVTNVTNAKATYNKSKNSSQPTTLSAWNYITKMALDEENGMFNVIECGNSGSGSATGFCDGFYVDSGTSGQREFLLLGYLGHAAFGGLSCVRAIDSLSYAGWYLLARLSISGRKG